MLDRYLVAGGRALDLATGASIRWHVRRQRAVAVAAALHRARPVMVDRLRSARPNADRSVGAPRREACTRTATRRCAPFAPRWPTLATAGRARSISWSRRRSSGCYVQRVLAREARLAGFVPMAADAFGAVLSQARWRWPSWLKDRVARRLRHRHAAHSRRDARAVQARHEGRPAAPRRSRHHQRTVAAAARLGADARSRGRAFRARRVA